MKLDQQDKNALAGGFVAVGIIVVIALGLAVLGGVAVRIFLLVSGLSGGC